MTNRRSVIDQVIHQHEPFSRLGYAIDEIKQTNSQLLGPMRTFILVNKNADRCIHLTFFLGTNTTAIGCEASIGLADGTSVFGVRDWLNRKAPGTANPLDTQFTKDTAALPKQISEFLCALTSALERHLGATLAGDTWDPVEFDWKHYK